ncbi:MAG: DNA recombination protein RmuC [Archaeoglobaceae archaeon]
MIEYLIFAFTLLLLFLLYSYKDKTEELNKRLTNLEKSVQQMVENSVVRTIQNSASIFESLFASALAKNTEAIKGAFATSLKELGIQEDMGKLREASNDLKNITSDLKSMFEIKSSRAKFGELQLENLLRDLFPVQRLKFQENIGSGIPDACVLVEENRFLCIDSKFPLENFRKFCEAEKAEDKDKLWKMFLNDLERHVESIRSKYVGKENTLDFAFMFIPSDAIYYRIISESPEIAVEASKAGVILTSPSILPAYLNLISAKIRAEEISKSVERIQKSMDELGRHLEDFEGNLETLLRHVTNASNNVPKVQKSFNNLRAFYSNLSSLRDLEERK